MNKATICMWFDKDAEEAARFYSATLPDGKMGEIARAPGDYPSGSQGDVLTVTFEAMGMHFMGLNGGPAFTPNEAVSFQIHTEDQAETDRLWDAIVGNGGQESQCSWCKDKWGFFWQIVPRALTEGMADSDPATQKRVFDAMMTMGKIDVAKIEAARAGEPADA